MLEAQETGGKKSSLFYERYMFVISHADGFIMNCNLLNRRIPAGGTVHGEKIKAKGGGDFYACKGVSWA